MIIRYFSRREILAIQWSSNGFTPNKSSTYCSRVISCAWPHCLAALQKKSKMASNSIAFSKELQKKSKMTSNSIAFSKELQKKSKMTSNCIAFSKELQKKSKMASNCIAFSKELQKKSKMASNSIAFSKELQKKSKMTSHCIAVLKELQKHSKMTSNSIHFWKRIYFYHRYVIWYASISVRKPGCPEASTMTERWIRTKHDFSKKSWRKEIWILWV